MSRYVKNKLEKFKWRNSVDKETSYTNTYFLYFNFCDRYTSEGKAGRVIVDGVIYFLDE